jgi:hypothetical protein
MSNYQPGDYAWWQALKGRIRTPNALPVRIIRKLRTRYEVQVLDFRDHGLNHARWEPMPASVADLTPMKQGDHR